MHHGPEIAFDNILSTYSAYRVEVKHLITIHTYMDITNMHTFIHTYILHTYYLHTFNYLPHYLLAQS